MSAGRSLWIWHLETGAQRLSGAPSVTLRSPQVGQQQVAASVLAERRQNALVNTVGPLHLGIARDLAEQPPKRMVLSRYNSFRVRRRAKTVPLRNRFSSAGGPAIRFAGRSMSSGAAIIRATTFQCPQGALPISRWPRRQRPWLCEPSWSRFRSRRRTPSAWHQAAVGRPSSVAGLRPRRTAPARRRAGFF